MTMFPQCQESFLEYKYKGDKFKSNICFCGNHSLNLVGVHAVGSSELPHIFSLLFHEI